MIAYASVTPIVIGIITIIFGMPKISVEISKPNKNPASVGSISNIIK